MIPLLSILVPLTHYVPMAYKWVIRRRLLHWYERLTALENSLDMDAGNTHLAEKTTELNNIEGRGKPHQRAAAFQRSDLRFARAY